jgi:hypothetical protein
MLLTPGIDAPVSSAQRGGLNMAVNVGGIDRILRIVAGLAVLSLFFVLEGNARYWALLGFVPLLTGVFRYCPAYSLIGLSTCPMKRV